MADSGTNGGGKDTKQETTNLYCNMERAFGEYAFWTREMLVFVVSGVNGRTEVIEKYKKIPDNIASGFKDYYGVSICNGIKTLYYEQALLMIELARAYTYENAVLYDGTIMRLERNNADLAAYFFTVNPIYDEAKTRGFLQQNVGDTVAQIHRRFRGEFDGEIASFDSAYGNIIGLADYIADNIVKTEISV
ncbi:MAG: hypothetical protein LBT30_08005 [Clostridiales bacterium]|jgi:hypothetical protein|nr:hypothetical protein [Clostridiales bacterium]